MVFNHGAVGTVTAATSTTLTVSFTIPPANLGALLATVSVNGISSGAAVEVATVVQDYVVMTLSGIYAAGALACDSSGNLFAVNSSFGNTVSKFAPGATTPSATISGFNWPNDLAVDSSGNLFVANSGDSTVSMVAPGAITPSATLTGLNFPVALAVDSSGNLFVANGFFNYTGNLFVINGFYGNTVSKFAPGSTTPSATLTGLNQPSDLAVDSAGNLFVADPFANTVSKFAQGATTPSATLTGLSGPQALAVDSAGNLFVANLFTNTVSKFAPGATTPSAIFAGVSGPTALAVDNALAQGPALVRATWTMPATSL